VLLLDRDKPRNWAVVAEVVSALAVVITLIFVVVEMRNSTSATQAQTYQLLMQEMNAYRTLMTRPDLVAITLKAQNDGWETLEEMEQSQLYSTAAINWGFYESAYYANKRGVLGDSEWTRFESGYCRRIREQPYVWSQEEFTPMSELLTTEFLTFVQSTCE